MKTLLAWLKVIALGVMKLPVRLSALLVVPLLDDEARVNHPVYGVRDATDLSYYNIAWRNATHNLTNRPNVPYSEWTNTPDDPDLEYTEGFQWRYRESTDKKYVSFRITWGEPRRQKGKREFYVGWTMGQTNLKGEDMMRLTFFQLRPFPMWPFA